MKRLALVAVVLVAACSTKEAETVDTAAPAMAPAPAMMSDSAMRADSIRADSVRADSAMKADTTKKP